MTPCEFKGFSSGMEDRPPWGKWTGRKNGLRGAAFEFFGDRTFPKPYCVRASPFSWGGIPKPLAHRAGKIMGFELRSVPREFKPIISRPPRIHAGRTRPILRRSPCGTSRPRIRRPGPGLFSLTNWSAEGVPPSLEFGP